MILGWMDESCRKGLHFIPHGFWVCVNCGLGEHRLRGPKRYNHRPNYDGSCYYCQVRFGKAYVGVWRERHKPTQDHVIPRASGGTDAPANLVKCCLPCNVQKGHMSVTEFLASAWLRSRRNVVQKYENLLKEVA